MRTFPLVAALVAALLLPAAAHAAPTASYTTSPAGPPWYTGEQLTFTSTGTCDVAPCTYSWADDGTDGAGGTQWPLGTGNPRTFTFQNPGTKRVRLIITNASGQAATTMRVHELTRGPRPTPPAPAQCADGVDNADPEDTLVDLADPGCSGSTDNDETDAVTPPPPSGEWPNLTNTGARGAMTDRSTSITASTTGQVIENLRLLSGASIQVNASNVVIRNVRLEGGFIRWSGNRNVLIEDTTLTNRPGQGVSSADRDGVVGYGGGTLRRVQITNRSEGVRDGDSAPLTIEDSFIEAERPATCGDWHGDALQGYGSGGTLTVRNTYFELNEGSCGGTAPFFYPGRDNTGPVVADRVVVRGGGYSFRMSVPGSVTNLHIADDWGYGPISVKCSVVSPWSAWVSSLDANYQPTSIRSQPCSTEAPPGT
jgi:hypothetical protein